MIKLNLKAELFSLEIEADKKRLLELLNEQLLLVINANASAAEMQRYKSLANIERLFRVYKPVTEIGPVYHRLHSTFEPIRSVTKGSLITIIHQGL